MINAKHCYIIRPAQRSCGKCEINYICAITFQIIFFEIWTSDDVECERMSRVSLDRVSMIVHLINATVECNSKFNYIHITIAEYDRSTYKAHPVLGN